MQTNKVELFSILPKSPVGSSDEMAQLKMLGRLIMEEQPWYDTLEGAEARIRMVGRVPENELENLVRVKMTLEAVKKEHHD